MKAISTKFVGPTNTRGARIVASDSDGNKVTIGYHSLDGNDEMKHRAAAEALRDKMGWSGALAGGFTKNGWCWVFRELTPTTFRRNPSPNMSVYERLPDGYKETDEYLYAGIDPSSGLHTFREKGQGLKLFARSKSPSAGWHLRRGQWYFEFVRSLDESKRNPVIKRPGDGVRIVHNRLLGGWYVVRGPHQTPLNGRFDSKAEAQAWLDERSYRRNPIKGPGKFEGELYLTRFAYENVDDELGDVQDFGWYGRMSGKVKGRGPFHIIVHEDSQGFVSGDRYDTEAEMMRDWRKLEREYEKFSKGQDE